ncbi:MAG: hypothetical protein CL878_00785 [Dehalococcoidia bacterium]|nr:hypothetical protein [Dehalococcoidia bacterium]
MPTPPRRQRRRTERRSGGAAVPGEDLRRPRRLAVGFGPRIQLVAALVAWGAVGALMYSLEPASTPVVAAFFGLLFLALALTCAPIIYGLSLRFATSPRSREATLRRSVRQGVLTAGFVVANAALLLIHALSPLTALLTFGAFATFELVLLMRNRS